MLHGYIFYFLCTLLIGIGSLVITALAYAKTKIDWMPYYLYFYTCLTTLVGVDYGIYYLVVNRLAVDLSLLITLNYFEICVLVPLLTFILPVFVFVLCGLSISNWRVKLVGIVVGSEALLLHVLFLVLEKWGWSEFLSDLAIFGIIGYSLLMGLRTYRTLQDHDRQRLAGRLLLLLGMGIVLQFMDILLANFLSILRLYPLAYCGLGITFARYGSRVLLAPGLVPKQSHADLPSSPQPTPLPGVKIPTSLNPDEAELASYAFSEKEKDILLLTLKGCSNAEIGEMLHISLSTVKAHLTNIYKKAGVKNRYELFACFTTPQRPLEESNQEE
jgi:DNA-binding CsgD family transcriptional regulator